MVSIDKLVKYSGQASGRERLLRLFQYTAKFADIILTVYYRAFSRAEALEFAQKFRILEEQLRTSRRLINFGRCGEVLYSGLKCLNLYDPVLRTSLTLSKSWTAFQLFSDHVLLLQQVGFLKIDKVEWSDRVNKFWLYATSVNLVRDIYELLNIIQKNRVRNKKTNGSTKIDIKLSNPFQWVRQYPQLSCDLIKNFSDFWIPYAAVNKMKIHPAVIALLGMTSTTMNILQIYDQKYKLSPS